MPHEISKKLGTNASSLRAMADERLRDFEILWKAGQFDSAIYISGYALEGYLKCAICKTLRLQQLPVLFQTHELEPLLLFSGYQQELSLDAGVKTSFDSIVEEWNVGLRYREPSDPKLREQHCVDFNKWLNDQSVGLIPWFRSRL